MNRAKAFLWSYMPAGLRKQKTILVVGATGAGKSALIDGMANYLLGVRFEDPFRFKLVDLTERERERVKRQDESQTEYITAYEIPACPDGPVDFDVTIIDTPGFRDVRGIDRDKKITEQIRKFFSAPVGRGITTIDAVCFLIKAPDARLDPAQRYIFDSVLGLFGKDIEKNIMVMITFADGAKPPALAAVKAAKVPYNEYFKFNNSALYGDNDQDQDIFTKLFWDLGKASFDSFFAHLNTTTSRSLKQTREVLEEKQRLEDTVDGLTRQIDSGLARMDTLKQEEKILQQHQADIQANQNFEYTVMERRSKQIPLEPGKYITNCLHCHTTCHYPCRVSNDEEKERCSMMKNGKGKGWCRVCPKKCHWSKHVNQPFRYDYYEQKVKRTYSELKERYRKAQHGAKKKKVPTATLR